MHALTVRQPYCWMLMHPASSGKRHEYRSWPMPARLAGKWIALHTSPRCRPPYLSAGWSALCWLQLV